MRNVRHMLLGAIAATALAAGCTPKNTGPATGSALQAEEAQSLELLGQLHQAEMVIEDPGLNAYVADIASRIDSQRPPEAPPMRVILVKDPTVNAFTTGGGYVFLNGGMIANLENETQLAMVLAHETAHIDRGHVTEGQQHRQNVAVVSAIGSIVAALAGVPADIIRLGDFGEAYAVNSFTYQQEEDADLVGFEYHTAAGYNGAAGARSFGVLHRLYGDNGGIFATHPTSSERRRKFTELARREGADEGRVGQKDYDEATRELRESALEWYEDNNRTSEAAQVRRNLTEGSRRRSRRSS